MFFFIKTLTPVSEHDSKHLLYITIASCYTKAPIEKGYGDKVYFGQPNRAFMHLNGIKDGIMRKDTTSAKLNEIEKETSRYQRRAP